MGSSVSRQTNKVEEYCNICLDWCGNDQGVMCACNHFTCYDCVETSVKNVTKEGSLSIDKNGNMLCPYGFCNCTLQPRSIMKAMKNSECYLKHIITLHKIEWEKEVEKVTNRALDDAIIDRHYKRITNEILNLACPKCKQVYVDFDGCCALPCSNNKCDCKFCAWCLAAFSSSSACHDHVKVCPYNARGGYYHASLTAVNKATMLLKTEKFVKYWSMVDPMHKDTLRPMIVPLLEGVIHTENLNL